MAMVVFTYFGPAKELLAAIEDYRQWHTPRHTNEGRKPVVLSLLPLVA